MPYSPNITVCDIPPAPSLNLNQTDNVNVTEIKNHEKPEEIPKIRWWKVANEECVTIRRLRPFSKQRIYCNCRGEMMDLFVAGVG